MNLSPRPSLGQTLWRGLRRLCPSCGRGDMFGGYLIPHKSCSHCQLVFNSFRSDDAPAYFTIALVGHLIFPMILWAEIRLNWDAVTHFMVWLPLTIGLTLAFLPFIKGAVMAVIWRTKH